MHIAFRACAGAAGSSQTNTYVRLTTSGSTFAPIAELSAGSSTAVKWTCEETAQVITGLTPSFNFGSTATRHVRLGVSSGFLSDIVTLNLGFSAAQDAGTYSLGAGYNLASQGVTVVENLRYLHGLKRFMAAQTAGTTALPLACALDLTSMSALQNVECYGASVTGVTLTGCTGLIRLCVEMCNVTALDLNPVAGNLYDLRAAAQQGGHLAFTALSASMAHLYHFCVRDQVVTGIPTVTQLPVVQQLWIWNTSQSGTLTVNSPVAQSVEAYQNSYTSIVLTGQTTLTDINLHQNSGLNQAAVDSILAEVDSWGTSTGILNLQTTSAPSVTGQVHGANLTGRGWTVTLDSSTHNGVQADTFNRADVTGYAAIGNGWYPWYTDTANIVSSMMVRTASNAYRMALNPAGIVMPADYTVYAKFPGATVGTYLGLTGRWVDGTATGVRIMVTGTRTTLSIGNASGFGVGEVTVVMDAGFPADWATPTAGNYQMSMVMSGTTVTLFVYTPVVPDGQQVCHGTINVNTATTGTSYGICGEAQGRSWDEIGVTIP